MQSMQYLQIHNFASIIDSFMFDIALYAIVENELKIVSFSIMSYDRMIFMSLMDKPMTEVINICKRFLIPMKILSNHKISLVYSSLLHSFNVKEDILVTW